MKAIYTLQNLKSYYKNRLVLDIGFLEIERGNVTGFIGANGCGKSTLLRVLAFLQPYSGSLRFSGDPARDVTLLLQEPFLLRRSVFENVAFGLRLRNFSENEIKFRVESSLADVGLAPESFARRAWFELSGGEAQRVALASRLVLEPKVLLLDEPTASIDEASTKAINEVLHKARARGMTLVVASHDFAWLKNLGGHINEFNKTDTHGSFA